MSTSPVSYCWAIAATSPFASRLSRAAIAGSSEDGRTAPSLLAPLAGASLASEGTGVRGCPPDGRVSPPGSRGAERCDVRPGGCGVTVPVVRLLFVIPRSYEAAADHGAGWLAPAP